MTASCVPKPISVPIIRYKMKRYMICCDITVPRYEACVIDSQHMYAAISHIFNSRQALDFPEEQLFDEHRLVACNMFRAKV